MIEYISTIILHCREMKFLQQFASKLEIIILIQFREISYQKLGVDSLIKKNNDQKKTKQSLN